MELLVYPNPSNGNINVSHNFGIQQAIRWQIFDFQGRACSNSQILDSSHHIDLKSLPSGQYLLKLTTSSGVYTKKIVII